MPRLLGALQRALSGPSDRAAWARIADLRLGSIRERMAFAVAAGLLAALIFGDPLALAWIVAAAAMVAAERPFWAWALARVAAGRPPHLAAAGFVAGIAAAYGALALLLWTEPEHHAGIVGTLFLSAIVLSSVVTLRFAPAFVVASIAPTALYLALIPILWTPPESVRELAAHVVGVVFLLAFAGLTWRRMVQTDEAERTARLNAETARRAAENAQAAQSAFLAGMSRDLRTPMSMVLGAAAMLRRADLAAEDRATVDAMVDAGDVLVAVLDDILQASRNEDAARIKLAAVSPAHIARGIVRTWRPRAEDKWLELFLDLDPSAEVAVLADAARVKQILFSLVSNAVRFTDYGGVRVQVAASGHGADRRLLTFRVVDTGPGLTPVRAEALLAGRADGESHRSGGTLARCRTLARALGGDVTVETTPGEGAAFTLTLDVEVAAGPPTEIPVAGAGSTPGLSVLIVDDHLMSRQFAAGLLRELGAACTLAESGPQGLGLLAATPFDVLLLDLNMPEMSGFDVARALRASGGPNARIPIVALTAACTPEDQRRCIECGMDGFVAKPVVAADLFAEVWRVIDESESRRAA